MFFIAHHLNAKEKKEKESERARMRWRRRFLRAPYRCSRYWLDCFYCCLNRINWASNSLLSLFSGDVTSRETGENWFKSNWKSSLVPPPSLIKHLILFLQLSAINLASTIILRPQLSPIPFHFLLLLDATNKLRHRVARPIANNESKRRLFE